MEISSKELQEKINNGEKVIIKLSGEWCGPCQMLKPIFDKVEKENTTGVQLFSVDVDDNRDFAVSLGVRSVPTIKVFNGGENVETKVGLIDENELKRLIESVNG